MKFIHLSDLHLGKRVNEYSMLDDQQYILAQILQIIDAEQPDMVLISGDIYDKSVPSAEAVELCDWFLVQLAARKVQTFLISGNHDSPERLAFCNRLIERSGIHIASVYDGHLQSVSLEDAFGTVTVYLLPFVKPATVRRFFPEQEIVSYTDAVKAVLSGLPADGQQRSVLLAHQFVTGAAQGGSEELSVGGSENVDADVFAGFDYVALGHIHGPQYVGSKQIRYCGTPLKYSFSEASHEKSVTVVELREKGSLHIRTAALHPKRDLVELRGMYDEVISKPFYEHTTWQEDYTHITLTDEEDIPDAVGKLRVVYRNLMRMDYDNKRTRHDQRIEADTEIRSKSPLELFSDFYEMQNGQPMSEQQRHCMAQLIETVWEGAK